MFKRILVVLVAVLFLQTFFVNSAMADDKELKVEKKTKNYKWAYFASLPVYYLFVHVPIHETSHALAIGLDPNWEVGRYQPYPHFAENKAFLLGSVTSLRSNDKAWEDRVGLTLSSSAPYITDVVEFTTADLLLSTGAVEPDSVSGRTIYFAGMAMPWWDVLSNSIIPAKTSDISNIALFSGMPRRWVTTVGVTVSFVGIWRLVVNYNRVFPDKHKKQQDNKSKLVVVPIADRETVGVSVRGVF